MSTSPTQRTLERCRAFGWRAQVVEKWIPQIKRRIDLFGFGDVIALDGSPGSLLIQATSGDHSSNRVTKILDEEHSEAAREWLQAGNRIEVWSWAKKGPRGRRKVWTLRRVAISLTDMGLIAVEIGQTPKEMP